MFVTITAFALLSFTQVPDPGIDSPSQPGLKPEVRAYVEKRIAEFDQIPAERRVQLQAVAQAMNTRLDSGKTARLVFICTHNSRRSHMSQIWAAVAASHYHLSKIETFSGGTESTAFNPRAIDALRRAGLQITKANNDKNPRYDVTFHQGQAPPPLVCYSKVYTSAPNPTEDFVAIMTCSQADQTCPLVRGATTRIALPYYDPKVADDTPEESAIYDERMRQISRELLYAFSLVNPATR